MSQHSSPLLLSVCMIVRNEEHMLPDCLHSLSAVADEIIVVDTGSTDNTPTVARQLGCIVVESSWRDDFSHARNQALARAQGQWILSIDADERLLTPDIMLQTLHESSPSVGGYFVEVQSPAARKDGGSDAYVTSMIRLFRTHPQIRFYGAIHEQIWDTIVEAGFSIQPSSIQLSHLGYALSPDQLQTKQLRNLHLLDRVLATKQDSYALLQRGKTLIALERIPEAVQDLQQTLALATTEPLVRIQAMNYLAMLLYRSGRYDETLALAQQSLALAPLQSFAQFILGETYTTSGNFDKALEAYTRMRHAYQAADLPARMAGDYQLPLEQLSFRIGRCYVALKQWGHAEEEFRKGLDINPQDISCLVGSADIALKRGKGAEAIDLLQKAIALAPEREDIQTYLHHAMSLQTEKSSIAYSDSITISGALIVGDNTEGLEQALHSLQMLCDDIVVVHTGTSREVENLIERFRVRLFHHPWNDDFSAARNVALEHCAGTWIIMLDSDEEWTQDTADRIRKTLISAHETTGGLITRIEHHSGTGSSQTEILRIFRNHPSIRYEGFVHEQVTPSIVRSGLIVQEALDIIFLHHSAPPDEIKRNRYQRLLIKEIERQGNQSEAALFQYVLLLFNFGNTDDLIEGLQALDRYVHHPLARRDNTAILLNSYARLLLQQEQWEQIISIAEDSIARFPEQREAWWYKFLGSTKLEHYIHAFQAFRTLTTSFHQSYTSALTFEKQPETGQVIAMGLESAAASGSKEFCEYAADFARKHGGHQVLAASSIMLYEQQQWLPAAIFFTEGFDNFSSSTELFTMMTTVAQHSHYAPLQEKLHSKHRVSSEKEKSGNQPLVSLSMIVKNEEKFLPDCLESVRGIVDEIIIADTGSTDRTIGIAQMYGAKVVHTAWQGDFAAARNFSLQHCTGQWIVYLDADERLEPQQGMYIRSMLESAEPEIGALLCNIISPHRQNDDSTEHHVGAYPRIFRNYGYPTIRFQGRVHEQISPSILALDKGIANSDINIHHLGYDQSREVMQKKVQRNYQLLLQHIQEEPTNGQAWMQLGFTLAHMSLNKEAEEALLFAMKLGNLPSHLAASASSTLAQIAGASRRFIEALHWAEQSLHYAPDQVYAFHLKAYALLYLRRFEESEQAFQEVLRRLDRPKSNVQVGYDVAVPREAVLEGIQFAREKRIVYSH